MYTYDFAVYTGYEHGNDAGLNDAGSVCDVYYESYDIVFGGCDGYAYKNESCENHAGYEHGCDARQGYFDTSGEGYALVGYMYGYAGCAGYEDGYENMYTGYEQGNGASSVCYVYCGSYDIVFGGCDGYAHKIESCENYAGYEHGYDARQGYFDTSCDGFAHGNGCCICYICVCYDGGDTGTMLSARHPPHDHRTCVRERVTYGPVLGGACSHGLVGKRRDHPSGNKGASTG